MRTIYSWTFPYFDVAPNKNGLTNVVKVIHWRYRLDKDGLFSEIFGSTGLDGPSSGSFVPYDQITEPWAIEMVNLKNDVAQLQEALLLDIESQKNPPTVQMAPPFANGPI